MLGPGLALVALTLVLAEDGPTSSRAHGVGESSVRAKDQEAVRCSLRHGRGAEMPLGLRPELFTRFGRSSSSKGSWRRAYDAPLHRWRRDGLHHQRTMDPSFVHLPMAALEHLPDGERACDAMRNASAYHQVMAAQMDVVVEPPCPVTLRPHVDPLRVWPVHLTVVECACPGTSCKPRTAYVCTQIISPVVVVVLGPDGGYHQHRTLLPSGCRCMAARATLAEDPEEDFK